MSTKPTAASDLRNNYLLALNALVGILTTTDFTPIDPAAFTEKYQISKNALLVLGNMGFLEAEDGNSKPAFKRTSGLLNVKPEHLIKWVARYNSENSVVEAQKQADVTFEAIKEAAASNFNDIDSLAKGVELLENLDKQKSDEPQQTQPKKDKRKAGCSSGCIRKSAFQQLLTSPLPVQDDEKAWQESGITLGPTTVADTLKHWSADPQLDPQPLAQPYDIQITSKGILLDMTVSTTEDADIISAVLYKLNRVK